MARELSAPVLSGAPSLCDDETDGDETLWPDLSLRDRRATARGLSAPVLCVIPRAQAKSLCSVRFNVATSRSATAHCLEIVAFCLSSKSPLNQPIPKWTENFLNYRALKQNVKRIKLLVQISKSAHHGHNTASADRFARVSIFDPFRFTGTKIAGLFFSKADEGGLIIQEWYAREGEESRYHRDLETLFTEDDEMKELLLNKVNQFYESKEEEFLERGHILKKQHHVLLDLECMLHDRQRALQRLREGIDGGGCHREGEGNEDGIKGRKEKGQQMELPANQG
ncbi:Phosphate transporter [Nymphaea thermarum]|nr:Phosphate transporter [Nymphaea thermarum]